MRTRDFTEWVRDHHKLQRVVADTDEEYIRPSSWVVVQSVPRHWVCALPVREQQEPVHEPSLPCCEDDEFGPDVYLAKPSPIWARPATQPNKVDYFMGNQRYVHGFLGTRYP